MPTSLDHVRRARVSLRSAVSVFAAVSSVLLLATCDLDKITSTPKPGSGPTLNFSISGGTQVILAGTTTLSVSPSFPNTIPRWSSSAPATATVDSATGIVTGLSIGTATITARLLGMELDTGFVKTQDITVRYKGIRVTPVDSIPGLGQTRSASVFGLNALNVVQAASLTSASTLAIHDSGATTQTIASLTGTTIKGLKNGTAYLRATFDTDLRDSIKVKVRQVAKNIVFPDSVYVANAMNVNRFIPRIVRDVADSIIAAPVLRWRSSDTNKVAIDSMTGALRVKQRDTARVFVRMDTVNRSIKVKLVQFAGILSKSAGDAQTDTVGRVLPVALEVTALDSGNAVVPGATVTFRVGTGGGTLTDSVKTTDANGKATLGSWTLGSLTGTQTVIASVGTVNQTFTATARPLPPARLAFQVQPTSAAVGASITPAVTVAVQDSLGNLVTTAQDSVFVALGNNPTAATLGGTLRVKAVNGIATLNNLTINNGGSGYTLEATSGALTAAISNAFDAYGTAAQLGFLTQPSNTTTGGVMTPSVRVAVQDATGNTITNSTVNVTIAINNCGTCPAAGTGTLSGTLTVAAVNGIATFNNLSISGVANGYKLQATSGTLTLALSSAFNITPVGTAAKLAFVQEPGNAGAGVNISPAITVAVQDAAGGAVTTSTATVSLTIASNANPGSSALSGGTQVSVNAVNGVATFSSVNLNKIGTGYKLVAASTGLVNDTSAAFNITAGAASKLGFLQNPSHTVVNQAMSPAVRVAVQDANGNTVTTAAATAVTLALSGGGCTATVGGGGPINTVNGVATFNALTFTTQFSNCAIIASSTGLSAATSTTFNSVAAGGAVKLGFVGTPANTGAGTNFGTLQVALQDASGATVTSASTQVTLSLGTNPRNGTLFGNLTGTTTNGVATFSTVNIRVAADGYTLLANATGYQQATSGTFNITPGAISQLGFVQAPTSRDAGVPFDPPIAVAVQDQYGNTVTSAANQITMGLEGNGEFIPWWQGPSNTGDMTTAPVTAVNGVATFYNLRLKKAQAGLKVYACSPSCSAITYNTNPFYSDPFAIRTGPASALVFRNMPGGDVTAGSAYSFDVSAADSVGNPITDMNAPVTVGLTGGNATAVLSGTTTVTAVNGTANFTGMSIDKSGTGYRMNASASGFTTTPSPAFTVVAASPTKLGWIDQPKATFQNAPLNPSGQLPRIAVQDQFGNTSTQCCFNVRLRIGTAPGGVQMKSNGNTVPDVVLDPTDGVFTIPATVVLAGGTGAGLRLLAEQAFSTTLTSATSDTFSLAAFSTKSKLGFLTPPPTDNGYAVNVSPAVEVAVQDTYGNTVTTALDQISLALIENPGSATLRGGSAKAAVAGIAAFDALSLDKTASGYKLEAAAAGLSAATTGLFNVTSPGVLINNLFNLADMVAQSDTLYWVDNATNGNLQRLTAFGGTAAPIAATATATKVAADAANVYWLERGDGVSGAVKAFNRSTATPTTLTAAADVPSGLTGSYFGVDAGFVYYVARNDSSTGVSIRRVAIGGGTSQQLLSAPFAGSLFFLLDAPNDFIYYHDPLLNAIRRMNRDGSNKVTLVAGQNAYLFAQNGTTLYIADGSFNVRSLSTTTVGGTVTPLLTHANFVQALGVNGSSLYVDVQGQVKRYPLSGVTPAAGVIAAENAWMSSQLVFDAASLFYYTGGQIQKVVK